MLGDWRGASVNVEGWSLHFDLSDRFRVLFGVEGQVGIRAL